MAKYKVKRKFAHAGTKKSYKVGDEIESEADFSRAMKKGFVEHISGKLPEPKQTRREARKPQADGRQTAVEKPAKSEDKKGEKKPAAAPEKGEGDKGGAGK